MKKKPKAKAKPAPPARQQTAQLRRLLFAQAYLGGCRGNATESARFAGYSGNDATLGQRGHELLNDAVVQQIVQRAADQAQTDTAEVMQVLVRHMRGTMRDFISFDGDDEPRLDLVKARDADRLHLLKKFKEKRVSVSVGGSKKGESELISETVTYEIELYDAQKAAALVGRPLGLFGEKLDDADDRGAGRVDIGRTLELLAKFGIDVKNVFPMYAALPAAARHVPSKVIGAKP